MNEYSIHLYSQLILGLPLILKDTVTHDTVFSTFSHTYHPETFIHQKAFNDEPSDCAFVIIWRQIKGGAVREGDKEEGRMNFCSEKTVLWKVK